MYKEFYHFKENPFNVTSDPVFFFSSNCHSQAFSHLSYGIENRKGILLITGEVGTGKTTLCRTLLDKYRNNEEYNVKTALILNPSFSDQQLLQLILRDFGIQDKLENKFDLVNALNKFLLDETGKGNNIVLLIDEAQNLGVDQLEQIRLLSNLETEKEKLLQIILIGQPELCAKLALTSLRQLNQRIAVRYHLHPLKREEIKRYINHRLKIAVLKQSDKSIRFTDKAIDVIYESCKGTPRLINIICERALLAGYTQETFIIDLEIINKCVKEVGINIDVLPDRNQEPQKDFEPEKIIVDSTKKRKIWYKNVYVLIVVFFAVVGPLYAVLDYFGLTTSQKPSNQKAPTLSDATDKYRLSRQKSMVPYKILEKPVAPEMESVISQDAQGKQGSSEQKSVAPSGALEKPGVSDGEGVAQSDIQDKPGFPEQKSVVPSGALEKPDVPERESVVSPDAQDKPGLQEQKSSVLTNVSEKSFFPIQMENNQKRFRLLKPSTRKVESAHGKYMKGLNYYEQGRYSDAAIWFHEAAEQGHMKAQSNLGVMYSEGQGVKRDYDDAVKWCRKAAKQGYAQAQTNLCIMYSQGKGVLQDYNKMAKWCHKAAGQGNGQAQAILGIMYSEGQGVERDTEEAVKWFEKAAGQGIDYAKNALKRLELDRE